MCVMLMDLRTPLTGSCYYNTHHNFFPLSGGGLKNDFGGHDNHHHNNIYYTMGGCMRVCTLTLHPWQPWQYARAGH